MNTILQDKVEAGQTSISKIYSYTCRLLILHTLYMLYLTIKYYVMLCYGYNSIIVVQELACPFLCKYDSQSASYKYTTRVCHTYVYNHTHVLYMADYSHIVINVYSQYISVTFNKARYTTVIIYIYI